MKTLKDIELKGKKVVLRAGFDVPVENGAVVDDARIVAGLKTIKYILDQQPDFFVIINHLGRPEGKREKEFSNKSVADVLGQKLGKKIVIVEEIEDLEDLLNSNSYDPDTVYFLENLRFWQEETDSDEEFGKRIGQIFDVYANDAFSVSHRDHASFTKIPKYAKEKCAGFLLEEEYANLKKIKDDPAHPAVMVIGGAKIETKLPVIENMMKVYDKILVGGLIANEAIDQKMEFDEKVLLPVDFAPKGKEEQRLDIGPKTVELFKKEIAQAKTVVWNGPMGKFEDKEAENGTKEICRAIAQNHSATQVLGGGETLEAVKKFGDFSDFDYVSMSGGAMLEYLEGKDLPGLRALEEE